MPLPASRADSGKLVVLQCSSVGFGLQKTKGIGTVTPPRVASGTLANWDGTSHAARDRGIITAKQSRDVRVRPSLAKADLSAKNNSRIRQIMPFLGATSEVEEAFQPGGLSRQVKVRQDEFSLIKSRAIEDAYHREVAADFRGAGFQPASLEYGQVENLSHDHVSTSSIGCPYCPMGTGRPSLS